MKKKIYDYSLDTDEDTLRQFRECYSQKFVTSAALMPDAHKGYVAPIGAVLITKGYIVPSWVGFDIGCGMIAMQIKGKDILSKISKNIDKIYAQVGRKIPLGVGNINREGNITKKTKEEFGKLLSKFKEGVHDKNVFNFIRDVAIRHLGTLGGGNHFIELGFYKKEVWLIIHSGSRGIGHKIAKRYMIDASNSKTDYERTFPLDVKSQLGKEYINILNFGLDVYYK